MNETEQTVQKKNHLYWGSLFFKWTFNFEMTVDLEAEWIIWNNTKKSCIYLILCIFVNGNYNYKKCKIIAQYHNQDIDIDTAKI